MTCASKKEVALLLCLLLCLAIHTSAQKASKFYRSQLTLVSENDNYTFKYRDRYYSNGLFLRFSKALANRSPVGAKRILTAEGGHMIFIPYLQNTSFRSTMDRPFTGLLYAKGGLTYLSSKNNVWRWNIMAGVIGEAAKGREVQRWHHKNFGLPYPYGWETQLKSEWGVNLQAAWYQHLLKPSGRKFMDLHAKTELQAGTFFTNLSSGLLMKLGAFERSEQCAFWDAGLNAQPAAPNRNYELFFYFEPMLTCQLYNATIQGGVSTHEEDVYTTEIQPFFYSHRFGMIYAQGPCSLQLGFTFKTKEARTMKTNENYGTIALGYKF